MEETDPFTEMRPKMSKLQNSFSRDSKFFFYMDKISKLIILNLLFILFSLPLVTFGASLTALHRVLWLLNEDEEGNVFLEFWNAFRENFWKATCIWLCFAAVGAFLLWDYYLLRTGVLLEANWLQWPVYIIAALAFCSGMWAFVLQSRYENKVIATMRNGFIFTFLYFLATVMMVLAAAVPVLLLYISLYTMPVVLLCGFSGTGLLQTMLYSRVFDKLEEARAKEG